MLKAKLSNYYRSSKTGQPVFVYTVSGSDEELAAYKAAKKQFFREDKDGNALMFSPRALSNNRSEVISLSITTNGNVVVDDLTKVLSQNEKLEDYILREQARVMASAALARAGIKGISQLTAPSQSQANAEDIDFIEQIAEEVDLGSNIAV